MPIKKLLEIILWKLGECVSSFITGEECNNGFDDNPSENSNAQKRV